VFGILEMPAVVDHFRADAAVDEILDQEQACRTIIGRAVASPTTDPQGGEKKIALEMAFRERFGSE
jgi:hypothetical protein